MKIPMDLAALRARHENVWAWSVAETLQHRGFQVYFVGGCVRDWLLGRQPHDLDLVTEARPEEIEKIFPKTVAVGKAFGVMRVLGPELGQDIEVATFRKDGLYIDGRRPLGVEFSTPREDAERRDFTINGLMMNPWSGEIYDYVGGVADLNAKILRTIGDAPARFLEDHLRVMRAIRLAATLDFTIEEATWAAICDFREAVPLVSVERLREETSKMLSAPTAAIDLLEKSGLRQVVFPEFSDARLFLRSIEFVNLWHEADQFGGWANWAAWIFCSLVQDQKMSSQYKDEKIKWDHFLKRLRFSAHDQKKIYKFLESVSEAQGWRFLSVGERLLRRQDDGVEWAIFCLATGLYETGSAKAFWLAEKETRRQQGELPQAFLSGNDFFGRCQPRDMGKCIHSAYVAQIEGAFGDREEALRWLDKTFPLRSNEKD